VHAILITLVWYRDLRDNKSDKDNYFPSFNLRISRKCDKLLYVRIQLHEHNRDGSEIQLRLLFEEKTKAWQ